MQSWLQERISAIGFLVANPVWLLVALAFAAILYWINSRIFNRILRKQAAASMTGWDTGAGTANRRHQTGIGTREVAVMKPPRRILSIAFWNLLFFGGGAVFYWFAVLPDPEEQTFKNWSVFAGLCGFSILGLALLATAFTRIEVSSEDIVLRRLFRRPRHFLLSEVAKVEPAGKNPATGVKLVFPDNRSLRLLAAHEGYADVLALIQGAHPDLRRLLMIGRLSRSAANRKAA
ncbi:hypothetical protein AADZ90_011725 [Aestuariibius sp. 2305UL40-4]|uniref:hypothetical protein n=1 Tax=Aestuariibius violaceus TaxID=3234132 RepID=UPI00345E8636